MSILKSILHRYNTTNQNYDTLHPETEHAQVTDFGQGVIAHLASSTLVSLVTSVSTGSVFGKMVEKLLEASGVQYNFTNANAWYICLGSLFGGLIIQGGTLSITINSYDGVYYPISFTRFAKVPGITLDKGCSDNAHTPTYTAEGVTLQSFTIFNSAPTDMSPNATWIAFGV